MKHLLSYNKLFEGLGVLDSIYPIMREVQQNISEENPKYSTEITVNGLRAKLNFELNVESTNYRGVDIESFIQLQNNDLENIEILISLADTKENTLIHELKHIHRLLLRKLMTDEYYYLNHVGRDVIERMKELLKDEESGDILTMSLYIINDDEFEAYYNDYYEELKNIIKPEMSPMEKRGRIREFLESQILYSLISDFKKQGGFDLSRFFKSNAAMNHYLKALRIKIDQFEEDDPDYEKWDDVLKDWLIYAGSGEGEQIPDTTVKEINRIFNRIIDKGFRKFHRLYTIFS